MAEESIARDQAQFFGNLLRTHGNSPMGTSSESLAHKRLRFSEIFACLEPSTGFSIHDVGMGLGHFYDFLATKLDPESFDYSGSEILEEYVAACRARLPRGVFHLRNLADPQNRFEDVQAHDYVVLSGVFHQMQKTPIPTWEKYLKSLLRNSFSLAKKAMVFNLVSPYVGFYQPGIYYAKLGKILDFVTEDLSRFFILRHNYALYEFTVAVYTEAFVQSKFDEPEFGKYFGP